VSREPPRARATPADLHIELDRLLRQRVLFERARTDPKFRYFKPVKEHRLRISEEVAWAAQLNLAVVEFAARLIGDDALGLVQPPADLDALVSKSPDLRALMARFRPLLPHRSCDAAKHRIVAVLWLRAMLPRHRYKKTARMEVGEAYGRGAQTICGWEAHYQEAALKFAPEVQDLEPRYFYELVFRKRAGPRSLQDCGKAYRAWLQATRQIRISGRPAKKSP
jgi:hypothetical protein